MAFVAAVGPTVAVRALAQTGKRPPIAEARQACPDSFSDAARAGEDEAAIVTDPPPRDVCEEKRFVDRCPVTTCREHVPAMPGVALHSLPVCGRVLSDVAAIYGGMTRPEIAHYLGMQTEEVRWVERVGLNKARMHLSVMGG